MSFLRQSSRLSCLRASHLPSSAQCLVSCAPNSKHLVLTLHSSYASRVLHSNIYEDPSTRALPDRITSNQAIEELHGARSSSPTKSTMEMMVGTSHHPHDINDSSTRLISLWEGSLEHVSACSDMPPSSAMKSGRKVHRKQ